MYGAILGDIIGEPYGFGGNPKTKDFPLFRAVPSFTDDMHTVDAGIRQKSSRDCCAVDPASCNVRQRCRVDMLQNSCVFYTM